MGCICHSGLTLSFWSELHFRLNFTYWADVCHSLPKFSMNFFFENVILSWFCHSGLNFSFCPEFVDLGWFSQSGFNFPFYGEFVPGIFRSSLLKFSFSNEFVILDWICHFGLNFSELYLLFFPWAEFLIQGCLFQSRMNLSFWPEFVILRSTFKTGIVCGGVTA